MPPQPTTQSLQALKPRSRSWHAICVAPLASLTSRRGTEQGFHNGRECMSEHKTNGARQHESLDAVVIGTGVAGLYQLYKLRDEQGLNVKAIDAATGVGGTWYWNRYPGARFDSEAYIYQYLFSEELYKGWSWSERFPGQPEIEKWLNYVADKLDLRTDIRFSTTVASAVFNEATQRWTITTDTGDTIDAQFLITCCGMLSAPLTSVFPGQETFKGTLVHTGRWPKENIDLAG